MKKIIFAIMCCMLFIVPVNASVKNGLYYSFGDSVKANHEVNGSSVVGGTNVTNESTIDGINITAGSNVADKSKSEYALIFGETVKTEGIYEKDALLAGASVYVDGTYKRDVFIAGQSVTLNGTFGRDVTIYASTLELQNVTIDRNVTIYAESLTIGNNVKINGKLKYNEDVTVDGNISKYNVVSYAHEKHEEKTETASAQIISFVCLLVLYATIALLYPNVFKKLDNNEFSGTNIFVYMGKGAFLLILGPIVMLALFLTRIGMYVAALFAVLYILAICLSTLFAGYYVGHIIWDKLIKKEENILLSGLIGLVIVKAITMIPIFAIFVILFGMGLSLEYFKRK